MTLHRASLLLLVPIAFVLACGSAEPHPPVRLTLVTATTTQPLAKELAQAYSARYEYATVTVETGNSQVALDALGRGQADLALVSRELTPDEFAQFAPTMLTWDGIAVVVHPSNSVESLSFDALKRVFTGDILNWAEVGGLKSDIQVLSREDGSGTRAAFEALVMDGQRVALTALIAPSSEAVLEFAASHPNAIGYAAWSRVTRDVKAMRVNRIAPTVQSIADQQYPLLYPLLLVTPRQHSADVQAFIDFAAGPAGQEIVSKTGGK